MNKTIDVFSVGSFVMGLTICVRRQPVTGESIFGYNFDLGPGGKGFNQAVAAKRAGASVKTALCIGNDLFGQEALRFLKDEKLYSENVFEINEAPTGCGFVTLTESGENTIIINPGANSSFSPNLLSKSEADIQMSRVLIAQMEVPFDTVKEALFFGKKYGSITILNPAPAQRLTKEILATVDILTPNETEAKVILGMSPDDEMDVKDLIDRLRRLGAATIVITLGKDGAMILTNVLQAVENQVCNPKSFILISNL